MKRPVDRIVARLGQPGLVDALSTQLSGADFTTLMLEVVQRRAAAVTPASMLERYRTDRFVTPATAPFASLRRVEAALLQASSDAFETVTLAPLVPLGTHSAIATVAQNKVVTTVRHNEVAADPTNALALEAASRRRDVLSRAAKSPQLVALAALQRVVRAQAVSGPGQFAHFELLGLVSAGRDQGAGAFESAAAMAHLDVHVRGLRALGATSIRIALTDFSRGKLQALSDACRAAFDDVPGVVCRDDPERAGGAGYYRDFCFKVHAAFGDEPLFETSDGGIVDWTQRLVGSAKERCFISGLGIDRVALAITNAPPLEERTMTEKADRLLDDLKQLRDELKLKLHLAKADAKTEWDELEKKFNHLEVRLAAAGREAKGSAADIGAALGMVAEELKRGYERLKRSLD